jgi:hypothetical protein
MNEVDHSDHLIGTNNVMRKCLRWWKTLFFHLIDIAIVNGFIPFHEHQANFPDSKDLRRPPGTRSVIIGRRLSGKFVGSLSMLTPPVAVRRPTLPIPTSVFDSIHVPQFTDFRRRCAVCYKQGRGEFKVHTYCSAPQCGKYLHVTRKRNCCFGMA